MLTLGIVPARGGSKRIPGKNLLNLGGKPLVQWALESALRSKALNRIVLSSDDPEILRIGRCLDPCGSRVVLRERPPELSGDDSPAIAYVLDAVGERRAVGEDYDAIAIIQPTSPFTRGSDIDLVLDTLLSSGADSAVSVMRVPHAYHPIKAKHLDANARLHQFAGEEIGTTAADLPHVYVRNGSVYATRMSVLAEGKLIGSDCAGLLMDSFRSLDINEPLDADYAQFLLARYPDLRART